MTKLTVLDLFCGAGGFSEGFRQQGFQIEMGIDHWRPAIETFNHNFGLDCSIINILSFKDSIDLIENLPNTAVIVGSPPCVSFSSSNRSGKADKSMGVTLTEIFLKIVAVKKFTPGSVLKAWLMENVIKSKKYLQEQYTFSELGLEDWANKHGLNPNATAINLKGNSTEIDSSKFGSAQSRKRLLTGEFIQGEGLIVPTPSKPKINQNASHLRGTVRFVKQSLPKPNEYFSENLVQDPNYPQVWISESRLTDHFYDTGLYRSEWENSKFLKTNHPYMGMMSFPENENKPSRTITATKIGTSREAIIYRSEFERFGDGEFRTPTVREAATIMGFPLSFQFIGSEGAKWRLVGNAVCPCVSNAFASMIRSELLFKPLKEQFISKKPNLNGVLNLNTFSERKFNSQPKKGIGSRFRRHPFKDGNITVTLSNYDILAIDKVVSRWRTSVQYGNGIGFPSVGFDDGFYIKIEPFINNTIEGKMFIETINNGFSSKIADAITLQKMYEEQCVLPGFLDPRTLVDKVAELINNYGPLEEFIQKEEKIFPDKIKIPIKQVYALYAINKICSVANDSVYN